MTTPTTTVSPELVERIDMLREHMEDHSGDFWSSLGSLADIYALFSDEVKHLTGDNQQYDAMIACGLEDLIDLFRLVGIVLDTLSGPTWTAEARARLRERHPQWFAPTGLDALVAEVLNRV